ncbi:MAG: hypothetical protein LCH86_07685 [Proteobacteria bacterium]|nr:hypothetical protein [Pseudomonadota bacterium]
MTSYRLARPDLKIPMPDRGCRLFGDAGETVDTANPYYARLIADGDIIVAPAADEKAAETPRRNQKG